MHQSGHAAGLPLLPALELVPLCCNSSAALGCKWLANLSASKQLSPALRIVPSVGSPDPITPGHHLPASSPLITPCSLRRFWRHREHLDDSPTSELEKGGTHKGADTPAGDGHSGWMLPDVDARSGSSAGKEAHALQQALFRASTPDAGVHGGGSSHSQHLNNPYRWDIHSTSC